MTVTKGMEAAQKWCPRCQTGKPIQEFGVNRGRKDGLSVYCIECIRQKIRDDYLSYRRQALTTLGGECVNCGYDADERALQFDHTNSDGADHRAEGGARGVRFFRDIISGKLAGKIQILCANCNMIKVWVAKEKEGRRVYTREVPSERIDRPNARWTVEQREAQAAKSKSMWANPEKRAQTVETMKKIGQDPRIREIRSRAASESMKRRWASGEIPNRPGQRREVVATEDDQLGSSTA